MTRLEDEKVNQEKEAREKQVALKAAEALARSNLDAQRMAAEKANSENNAIVQPNVPPPQMVSDIAWQEACVYSERVLNIKNVTKPKYLSNMDSQNKLMREKMKINRAVGQLTRSQKQLVPLVKNLATVFKEAQELSNDYYELIMYMAAKKIVV